MVTIELKFVVIAAHMKSTLVRRVTAAAHSGLLHIYTAKILKVDLTQNVI